jgi:hypothetical protein
MMRSEISFNEASVSDNLNEEHVEAFLALVATLAAQQQDLGLLNAHSFFSAKGGSLVPLVMSSSQRDRRELLMQIAGRCRSGHGGFEEDWLDMRAQVQGCDSVGAAIARARGVGLLSIGSSSKWRVEDLQFQHIRAVKSTDDGATEVDGAPGVLVNCFDEMTGGTYFRRWASWATTSVTDATTFWQVKGDVYPRLAFLDAVESQIGDLEAEALNQVLMRMAELDAAVEEWAQLREVDRPHQPNWRTRVTPESETRRKKCFFVENGESRLFELHARYTPGAGRIHFRIDRPSMRIVVAYVGWKLV